MIKTKPLLLTAAVLLGTAGPAAAHPVAPHAFKLKRFAGAPSTHSASPDDIAYLDGHVFVAWQNGVGTKGEPAPKTHATSSQLVEYARSGRAIRQWTLAGKIDGLAGDPKHRSVIATANEDGNSHLFTVSPSAKRAARYRYAPNPSAKGSGAVHTGGGTDSVTVLPSGGILVSASAPTGHTGTASFRVLLGKHGIARLSPTFADDARATDHTTGKRVTLNLTDPDSNALVPRGLTDPFAGAYVLNSQADDQLIFDRGNALTRLRLTYGHAGTKAGVDDVRWAPAARSTLYVVDGDANTVYTVTGPFAAGDAVASTDSLGGGSLSSVVASLDDRTGRLTPLITGLKAAKGLLFVP